MPRRTVAPISKFLRSYLETALWSSTDEDGDPLDREYGIGDFAPSAVKQARKDVEAFEAENADDLLEAGDSEQNGHDFWLTRNLHGTGFWDRDYGEVGDRLTEAAHAFGEVDVYIGDDGLLYFSS